MAPHATNLPRSAFEPSRRTTWRGHVLVLGGARSGKTGFAERLAMRAGERPLYLATAQALDAEMRERVKLHQQQRHKRFATLEEPLALADGAQGGGARRTT